MRRRPSKRTTPRLEELEPRILFSADAAGLLADLRTPWDAREAGAAWQAPAPAPAAAVETQGGPRLEETDGERRLADQMLRALAGGPVEDTAARPREIVFVDAASSDLQDLLASLDPAVERVVLDPAKDGLVQIAERLEGMTGLSAVHLLSEGDRGRIQLGSAWLGADDLDAHADALAKIGTALAPGGDLLLYGCRVAEGDTGGRFIAELSRLTGADVAASTDLTGAQSRGGDWVLEGQVGQIETATVLNARSAAAYQGVLGNYVVTSTADAGAGSLRQAILDANANGGADSISFNIAGAGVQTITLASLLPDITETVTLDGSTQPGFSGPLIQIDGNALPGGNVLTLTSGASGSTVRGLAIVNSGDNGIVLDNTTGVTVAGNYVGLDAATGNPASNASDGIKIVGGSANVIGGPVAADRNLISGNMRTGIYMAGADGTVITGNYIGLDASGSVDLGNAMFGIWLDSATNSQIGGNTPGLRNVISGNGLSGLYFNATASGNVISGNYIGTDALGTAALGNTDNGVTFADQSTGNTLGGTGAGDGNVIAFNVESGLNFYNDTPPPTGNAILGNSIHDNGSLGINFSGTPANDALDADTGPNNLQNRPVLSSARLGLNGTSITLTLDGKASSGYRIEFFASATGSQGSIYLGFALVSTNGSGNWSGTVPALDPVSPANRLITATATDLATHDTSQFSAVVTASVQPDPTTSGGSSTYDGTAATVVDGGLTVADADDATLASATVAITGNFQSSGDVLGFTGNPATMGNIGAVYNPGTGVMTLTSAGATATLAEWQAALRSVTYSDTSGTPNLSARTVSFTLNDGLSNGSTATKSVAMDVHTFTVTSAADSGAGSLRQAIALANANAGTDTIGFAIGSGAQTISLSSALPDITSRVIIDATTQPGHAGQPLITLDGTGSGALADGLAIKAGGASSEVRGLAITGFAGRGIYLLGATGVTIAGNHIGVNAAGTAAAGNALAGVLVDVGSDNAVIGGSATGARNVISGNGADGIDVESSDGVVIQGNYIGTNAAGTAALGNTRSGVSIGDSDNVVVGGAMAAERNLISGNSDAGIYAERATGMLIRGNHIGVTVTGTAALGNGSAGIYLDGSSNNTIGGTAAGEGNVIAYSQGALVAGVSISTDLGPAAGNAILGNAIHHNVGLGIDLGAYDGVTNNDAGDADAGANALQNFPVIDTVLSTHGDTQLSGTINGLASRTLRIEFFANDSAEASGHGEGQRYLGHVDVTTDGSGNASFNTTLTGVATNSSEWVSATATDQASGNTSEFALSVQVAVNHAPAGTSKTATTAQDTPYAFTLADFGYTDPLDSPANAFQGVRITQILGSGTLTNNSVAVNSGDTVSAADINAGRLVFTPVAGRSGTAYAAFSFQVQDDGGTSGGGVDLDQSANAMTLDVTPADNTAAATYVVTNTNDSGAGSLRQAILNANTTTGTDTITFSIGSGFQTISLASALPTLTGQVTLDASTQPGYGGVPLIELVGTSAGGGASGFTLSSGASGSVVRGFVINGFSANGIFLDSASNVTVQGNYIGTDGTGALASANGAAGIAIANGSNNAIGGTTALERNVVSGNAGAGIDLSGTSANNAITGNYIGSNAAGTAAVGNGHGIYARSAGSGNVIGGSTAAERNLVSGNVYIGILATTSAVQVQGNYVGVNAAGTGSLGNGWHGILFQSGSGGSSVLGNVISSNGFWGIYDEVGSLTIQGNHIGTNAAGDAAQGNGFGGIYSSASNDLIGGTTASHRNVISGNAGDGIQLSGSSVSTRISGNYIGVGADGTLDLGNGFSGLIAKGTSTVITGNVISGNDSRGIHLLDGSGSIVQGNLIGTDATGTVAVGNAQDGIRIENSNSNTIGGTAGGQSNRIANSGAIGLSVISGTGNSWLGNLIYANASLGIDLLADGVTANDAGDGDTGPNGLQNFPVISTATSSGTTTTVTGTLNGTPGATFRIEFFANASADASGHGQGQRWLGSVSVTADGSGNASFNTSALGVTARGEWISATATDVVTNESSEFSASVRAPINSAPAGIDKTVTATEDVPYVFTLADFGFNDPDGDAADRVWFTTVPAQGVLKWRGAVVAANDSIVAYDIANGDLTYEPPAQASGSGLASFTFQVQDVGGTANGGADLDPTPNTITVDVTPVDDAPVLGTSGGSAAHTENGPSTVVDPAITVGDIDTPTLAGATVSISGNFSAGQDVLAFANDGSTMGNIAASYDALTGVLSLNSAGASATLAQWQSALRSVTYANTSDNPSTSTRTLSFVANDGTVDGVAATRTLTVAALNDAPVLVATAGTTAYTENGAPLAVDAGITVSDLDNTTWSSVTVDITGNFAAGQDILGFVNDGATMGNIAAVYDGSTGVLTLSSAGASATLAQWQSALRAVTYANSSDGPSTAGRTVRFTADDGAATSSPVTRAVSVTAVADAPTGADHTATLAQGSAHTFLLADFGFSDALDNPSHSFQGVLIGDLLGLGVLRNNGVVVAAGDTVLASDIALGRLVYTPPAGGQGAAYASFAFQVRDSGATAGGGANLDPTPRTMTLDVTPTDNTAAATYIVTNTNDSGAGSLRQAILNANASSGTDTIVFSIGSGAHTLSPTSLLPTLTGAVVLDGSSQPGYAGTPLITLDGALAGLGSIGLDLVASASGSTIRGLSILGFETGIKLSGTDHVTIAGNHIGVAADGVTTAATPAHDGVWLQLGAHDNTIGGTVAADRNIISGNDRGIFISSGANTNAIVGNTIGLNAAGTAAVANHEGIRFDGADANTIGGTAAGQGNVISGNGTGISAGGSGANTGNVIQGNAIGTNAAGTAAVGNTVGISINSVSTGTVVGGTAAGAGNLIFGNTSSGVNVTGTGSPILGNSIYGNGGLGIDLGTDGVTANDPGDADAGGNGLANFPVLGSVTSSGGTTTLSGSLNSVAGHSYRIEFFANTSVHPSGHGEGQRYLGHATVTTDGSGNIAFSTTLNALTLRGEWVSATATDLATNETSEFATAVLIPVNHAPAGADKTVTTPEDTPYVFTIADFGYTDLSDLPADPFLSVRIATLPGSGALTLNSSAVNAGDAVLASDIALGRLVFTPPANANGAGFASFTFQVRDDGSTANGGADLDPTPNTITLDVTAVNDAPVLGGPGSGVAYLENGAPLAIDPAITVTDLDNTGLPQVTVAITGNFAANQDVLGFVNNGSSMGDISASFDAATGTLTLTSASATATLAQWQSALRAVTYANTSDNPGTATRTVRFIANDGSVDGAAVTRTVSVTAVNDAPVIASTGATTAYRGNGSPLAVDPQLTVSDVDNAGLSGAVVSIVGGYTVGQDVLAFVNDGSTMGNITAGFDAATGVLSLTSAGAGASVAQWQSALRAVTFATPSSHAADVTRTVRFVASDGQLSSAPMDRGLQLPANYNPEVPPVHEAEKPPQTAPIIIVKPATPTATDGSSSTGSASPTTAKPAAVKPGSEGSESSSSGGSATGGTDVADRPRLMIIGAPLPVDINRRLSEGDGAQPGRLSAAEARFDFVAFDYAVVQPAEVEAKIGVNLLNATMFSTTPQGSQSRRDGQDGTGEAKAVAEQPNRPAVVVKTSSLVIAGAASFWSMRLSGLLTSLVVSRPLWTDLDPIPMLSSGNEDDDIAPQPHLPDAESAKDENAAAALLDAIGPKGRAP